MKNAKIKKTGKYFRWEKLVVICATVLTIVLNPTFGRCSVFEGCSTDQGSNPHDAKAPKGSKVVGDYHTHGDYSTLGPNGSAVRTHDPHHDDFNSNHFSGGDKEGIAHDAIGKPAYRGYLGTPSGRFLVYNPSTGQEGPLQ